MARPALMPENGVISGVAPSAGATRRRVAVVVVAGVGDGADGDAASRIANGLAHFEEYAAPDEHLHWYDVPDASRQGDGIAMRQVRRFVLRAPGASATDVDVVELWWADLSRFPAALRSFLAAFVGLFVQFPALGRAALRPRGSAAAQAWIRIEPDAGPDAGRAPLGETVRRTVTRLDFHLVGFLEWLIAVPVVALGATLLSVTGGLVFSLLLRGAGETLAAIVLAGFAAGVGAGHVLGLGAYERRSGRAPVTALGLVSLLAAIGLVAWRLAERWDEARRVELALADTLAILVAFPMRILWLSVLLAVAGVLLILGVRLVRTMRPAGGFVARGRKTVTAALTLAVGPFGVALLMAILSGAVGTVGGKALQELGWEAPALPLVLASPTTWSLSRCDCEETNAWSFGATHLADAIAPLGHAAVIGAVLVALVGLVAAVGLGLQRWRLRGSETAVIQSERVSFVLRLLDHPISIGVVVVLLAVAAYAAAAAWVGPLPRPGVLADWSASSARNLAAIAGGGVAVLAVLGRVLGLAPGQVSAGGKASEFTRNVLDRPYDVATYLREPVGFGQSSWLAWLRPFGAPAAAEMPRERMLERYAALVRHVVEAHPGGRPYDAIVFVAHSQGTVLTTALLAHPHLLPAMPPAVSLVTFGCPLRQLYLQRFPDQFSWVADLADPATRRDYVSEVTGTWVNVASAGDPIGRTLFAPPPSPWPARPGSVATPDGLALPDGSPRLEEISIGAGGHSTYWTSPTLYARLAALIEE